MYSETHIDLPDGTRDFVLGKLKATLTAKGLDVEVNVDLESQVMPERIRAFLLAQPEALYVFMQFSRNRKMDLLRRWERADLPGDLLRELADVWGEPLPLPS